MAANILGFFPENTIIYSSLRIRKKYKQNFSEDKMEKVKKKLESYGYTCHGWLNAEETNILSCINPHGISVKVVVDDPKYKEKKHRYLVSEEDVVPEELLQKALYLVDNLTGAMVSCENGACLIRDGTVIHYNYASPTAEEHRSKERISPVVHLREIESNNKEILNNVELVHSRIYEEPVLYSADVVDKLENAFAGLNDAHNTYVDGWHSMMSQLIKSTEKLKTQIIEEAERNPNSERHKELKAALSRREQFITSLKDHAKATEPYLKTMSEMQEKMHLSHKNLEKEFLFLGE